MSSQFYHVLVIRGVEKKQKNLLVIFYAGCILEFQYNEKTKHLLGPVVAQSVGD